MLDGFRLGIVGRSQVTVPVGKGKLLLRCARHKTEEVVKLGGV